MDAALRGTMAGRYMVGVSGWRAAGEMQGLRAMRAADCCGLYCCMCYCMKIAIRALKD